ncbi:Detected protein of unknown function [Hibiscus syriacus]|uniref:Proline-rich protein PRCC n=1 Tax=Hibiscus syriacus TaxID=106335 RepID=A0A6A2Y1I8_HIBSY|nr:uncharacterized protein LOC120164798 [Hibiscus syriacus]KAE8677180.1 Detected protein of unknown function [Hibiscus syriacus]
MESLLANYASDDEEEPQKITRPPTTKSPSLPPPKSSSLFSSIPQPNQPLKSLQKEDGGGKVAVAIPKPSIPNSNNTSKLFSNLPQPKSQTPQPQQPPNPPTAKRIVQFKPPINPISHVDSDDDDDAEEEERRKRRESENLSQGPSVKSFLSTIPAPRNSTTLGVAPSSGSGRRSIIETTQVPTSTPTTVEDKSEAGIYHNAPDYSNYDMGTDANAGNSMNYSNYADYLSSSDQNSGNCSDQNIGHYVNYADYSSYQSSSDLNIASSDVATAYGSYENYGNYHAQYENDWADGSATTILPDSSGMAELGVKVKGSEGGIYQQKLLVKQDELMKNRPREDQVKMTGIAFGPSYQPASSKGKPNKLHKRKHQIGSLYFDMKQKEMELQERRSRGLLTKAETQAKYGW